MKNKTIVLTLFLTFLIGTASAIAQTAETPDEYRADSLFTSGGMLTVPEGMYRLVETWTLLEEQERTQDLAAYLYQNYPSRELVSDFLGLYQSGYNSIANVNKTTGTCVCKTLRPYMKKVNWTEDVQPMKGTNWNSNVNIHSSWNGKTNYSFHKYNQGPAINTRLRVGGDDGAADWAISKEDGYIVFEFLNLCTEAYLINTECNCDKFLEADAKYMHSYKYDGWSKSGASKHGRWARLGYGVGAFSFDRSAIGGINALNTNNLQMQVEIQESRWYTWLNPNFEGTLKIASSLAKTLTGVLTANATSITGGITALAAAVDNAGAQPSSSNSANPVSNERLMGGTVTLKANIPKVITYISVARLATGGMGRLFGSELNYDSFFWVTFKIPNTTFGFDVNGNQVPDACCNETYGQWWMSKNFAAPAYNYVTEKQHVLNTLDANSQAFNQYRWYNAIPLHNLTQQPPASIIKSDPNNPYLGRIDTNYGALESIDYCGCEDLKTGSTNLNVGLLMPDISSPNQSYCGTPFNLTDDNFNNVDLNKIQVDWYYKTSTSSTNTGNPIAGSTNNPSVSVNSPGIYTAVYTSLASNDCQSIDYIYIPECQGKRAAWDEETNSISIYPNPASDFVIVTNYGNTKSMYTYRVFNITGSILKEGNLNQYEERILLDDLSGGVYNLVIYNDANEALTSQKLILNK
jgi:hypothetical protein